MMFFFSLTSDFFRVEKVTKSFVLKIVLYSIKDDIYKYIEVDHKSYFLEVIFQSKQ